MKARFFSRAVLDNFAISFAAGIGSGQYGVMLDAMDMQDENLKKKLQYGGPLAILSILMGLHMCGRDTHLRRGKFYQAIATLTGFSTGYLLGYSMMKMPNSASLAPRGP